MDKIGDRFNGLIEGSIGFVTRLFGSANDRAVKAVGFIRPKHATVHTIIPGSVLDRVNSLEAQMTALSDDELKGLSIKFRERLKAGEALEAILPEAFAACREAGRRTKGMRHYDVQIVGGAILHNGGIAEMVTGEGKTLVATLPAYLNALAGKGVHVITVNDYLARRDCEWMLPIYNALGVSAGYIQSDMDADVRRKAYESDITYGTNSEFGFDYLRDNMKPARFDDEGYHPFYRQCQRTPLNFAIIDEVDNILIDEARTPLIISGPAFTDVRNYEKADEIARKLTELERKARLDLKNSGQIVFQGTEGNDLPALAPVDPAQVDPQNPPPKGVYFEIKEKERTCHLTDAGVREAERLAGVESFYTAGNMEWPHLIDNSLKAHHLYQKDRHYMIAQDPRENNQLGIIIIDEFTGRAMFGRQWSDGLHQSVEAKHKRDGVQIKQETQTLATVTLQNFFKLYGKLGGMTGTAMTEANEFWKIYKLDVVAIPTNKPLHRINAPDLVYRTEKEKWEAVVTEIVDVNQTGRPILIGTTDVAKSEKLSQLLKRRGIKHELLNAKPENVTREAEIVSQAGRLNAVTISTNMAGRGTDIILGGNSETLAWARLKQVKDGDGRPLYPTRLEVPNDVWTRTIDEIEAKEKMKEEGRKVAEMGGLHIVGTERHESRRIDNQLRGRAGRQGDPGSSRFYLSLEDELMRLFGGDRLKRLMSNPWLGMQENEALESGMLTKQIEKAQKRVEEYHFDQRKNLLEYDEVMDHQRKRTYGARQSILDGRNPRAMLLEMLDDQLVAAVRRYAADNYGAASFATFAGGEYGLEFDAADFKGASYEDAVNAAQDRALQAAPTFVQEVMDENLNPDEDAKDWKWLELTRAINTRYGLTTTDRDLKKIGRDQLDGYILQEAEKSILAVDLTAGKRYLDPRYATESLCDWARQKFGLKIPVEEAVTKDNTELIALLRAKVREAYRAKDAEFPVQVGLAAYLPEKTRPDRRPDRDGLFRWALTRLAGSTATISEEVIRTEARAKIKDMLLAASRSLLPAADYPELDAKLADAFSGAAVADADDAKELAEWCKAEFKFEIDPATVTGATRETARDVILNVYDRKYRSEMHQTERSLILEQLDGAWKSHLLTMDHLRSVVGLSGYAQEDPKIVYKREGMKLFDSMWEGVRDRVSESVFRMEDVADEQVEMAMWAGARAMHQQAESALQSRAAQTAAATAQTEQQTNAGGEAKKVETIRNVGAKVGRNDLCPCGSGKKYKNCHMKLEAK
ncbi:Protein export cytoplasm protein SecA ATPase RNA helicase [Fimbriiglobus ruber]|uniref:Protein translocase subunit SecA n=1 Tax=Fimbriiglobus ruber TaxID=1908690 RepID=A0A225E2T7_9BACT|nr:Protein export cytoplasm protein SecA ATPase RNA helicase [Fimbriiglobus ruber]